MAYYAAVLFAPSELFNEVISSTYSPAGNTKLLGTRLLIISGNFRQGMLT